VVNTLNRQLTADMGDTGRFVTLFLLEIDPGSGRIAWVRAGHDPAWRYGAEDGRLSLLDGAGMALGVEDGIRYAEARGTPLRPGDVLLIGTDGIWEAPSEDGSLFGKHRVEEALLANAAGSAEDICDALMAAVNRFMGSRRQEDDISMVVIKVPE
jgi:sigma-B regulation protein RsbU (phosphoserine phosphatase)